MPRSFDQQKGKILDAAAQIFATVGFAGARVDSIAAPAGVNKRLLYHYVGAKAALLDAVLAREAERVRADSVVQPAIWRLVLEEAAQALEPRLLAALADTFAAMDPDAARNQLARSMFEALLPGFVPSAAGVSVHTDPEAVPGGVTGAAHKPRVRMQPQLTRTQARSDSKRSK
jgi:AcrR family transcriptional regulator